MCGSARTGVEPRPSYGDYICRDLNCYDTYNGNDYKHGESWCVYDGTVGQGRDLVGSRHWRHLCVQGEEQVEPCDDYRQALCVQDKVAISNDTKFTEAACKLNDWRSCLGYNTKSNAESLCTKNPDCYWLSVWKTPFCVPNVPPGFNLKTEGGGLSASTFCSTASRECIVVYQKTLSGWKCIQNCECKEQTWVNQMNKLCTSVGDCGIKYNIVGEYTKDGYQSAGTPYKPDTESSGSSTGLTSYVIPAIVGIGGIFVAGKLFAGNAAAGAAAATGASGATVASAAATGAQAAVQTTFVGKIATFINGIQGVGRFISIAAAAVSVFFIGKLFGLDTQSSMVAAGMSVASVIGIQLLHKAMGWTLLQASGLFVWTIIIGIIITIIFKFVLKIGDTRREKITSTCLPWQPPSGGEDCEKCNKDSMKPCSKYRCDSLGASCSLLNEGTGNETCTWLDKYDTSAPTLKPWQDVLTKDHSYQGVKPCPPGPGCWKITRDKAADGCIKAYTPLSFGIETNEPAQCRIDTNHTVKFDDMQFFFGDNLYMYNHSMQMSLPAPEHINAQAESPELKNDGKYTLYIRCRDGNGNWNLGEMAVSFCVEPGPDTTPPVIMRTSIINGAPVSAGTTSTPLDIFLNEPSECKWSKTDQEYANMNNTFTCSSNIEQMEGDLTYKCSTTLTKIQDKVTNTFYFRCKDQPWLAGVNESDRNINKESYVFKLEGTVPLNITNVGPNGTLKGGSEPVSVTLTVNTANGYSNGAATCSYGVDGYDSTMIEFFTTGTSHHEQNLDLWAGDYKFYILCRDLAGNIDKNATSFKVELDKTAPLIVRVYQDGGMLKIITDEESDCRYGIKDCNYDFLSGTEMPFTNSTEHTAEWRTDITYYIKCKYQYGNMPIASQCQMQVNAYDVPSGP